MRAFGLTDRGIKREKNEDSIFLDDVIKIYIVADGMGGHSLGDYASQTAVKVIAEYIRENIGKSEGRLLGDDEYICSLVRKSFSKANEKIYSYSQSIPDKTIIGTTVSLALFHNDNVYLGHVGDSRIYQLRKDTLEKITKDHSKAQELVDAGLLIEEEAETHRSSHILTRAVGSSDAVMPDVNIFRCKKSDSFLLSTDGLFRVLGIGDVTKVMKENKSPEEKCRKLIAMAIEGGAPDNVSVIIIEQKPKSFFGRLLNI